MIAHSTVSDRLNSAISRRFPDTSSFQRAMQERGVPGSSQGSVYAYVKGASVPSLGFIESAAALLGVPAAWLAFGDGAGSPQCAGCFDRDLKSAELAERVRQLAALLP